MTVGEVIVPYLFILEVKSLVRVKRGDLNWINVIKCDADVLYFNGSETKAASF